MLHYWAFPNEGTQLLPATAEQSDITIRQYLNASIASPPASGFGIVAPYAGDIIHLAWPTDDYLSLQRTWHCIPCRAGSPHNQSHVEFDWKSCSYDESPPKLYSRTVDIDARVKRRPSLHTSAFELGWPYRIEEAYAMLCVLAIPGAFPEGLSTAFPFLNTAPPDGRSPHAFSLEAPTGVPATGLDYYLGQDRFPLGRLTWALLLVVLAAWMVAGRRYLLGKVAGVPRPGWARARKRGLLEE